MDKEKTKQPTSSLQVTTYGHIEKASKLGQGEVEFTVSTDAWDAHGERINVAGINLKDFKKNPVILWAHDSFNLPIAKATKVWKDGNKLMARAQFYLKDAFPAKVYNYITDGYLNAVSIGGIVDSWNEDGATIDKLTMKEFSVVPVPANQEALVSAKAFSDDQKSELDGLAKSYALKSLRRGDELTNQIKILKNLVATLEEVAHSETQEESAKTIRVVLRQAQVVDHQTEKIIKIVKKGGIK